MKKSLVVTILISSLSIASMLYANDSGPNWFVHKGKVARGKVVIQMDSPCGACNAVSENPISRMWHIYRNHTKIHRVRIARGKTKKVYSCLAGHSKDFDSRMALVKHINKKHIVVPTATSSSS